MIRAVLLATLFALTFSYAWAAWRVLPEDVTLCSHMDDPTGVPTVAVDPEDDLQSVFDANCGSGCILNLAPGDYGAQQIKTTSAGGGEVLIRGTDPDDRPILKLGIGENEAVVWVEDWGTSHYFRLENLVLDGQKGEQTNLVYDRDGDGDPFEPANNEICADTDEDGICDDGTSGGQSGSVAYGVFVPSFGGTGDTTFCAENVDAHSFPTDATFLGLTVDSTWEGGEVYDNGCAPSDCPAIENVPLNNDHESYYTHGRGVNFRLGSTSGAIGVHAHHNIKRGITVCHNGGEGCFVLDSYVHDAGGGIASSGEGGTISGNVVRDIRRLHGSVIGDDTNTGHGIVTRAGPSLVIRNNLVDTTRGVGIRVLDSPASTVSAELSRNDVSGACQVYQTGNAYSYQIGDVGSSALDDVLSVRNKASDDAGCLGSMKIEHVDSFRGRSDDLASAVLVQGDVSGLDLLRATLGSDLTIESGASGSVGECSGSGLVDNNSGSVTVSGCPEVQASLSATPASQSKSVEEDSGQTAGWGDLTVLHDGDAGSADVNLNTLGFTTGPEDCATSKTDWAALDCSACPAALSQGASCTCTASETDVDACDTGTWNATFTAAETGGPSDTSTFQLDVTSASASLTAGLTATQTTGPAPFGAVFDAGNGQTTHATLSGAEIDHHIWYDYTFQGLSGNFPFGHQLPRAEAHGGPLRARVWESAGTYDVTVTGTDASGDSDSETVQVQVTDPNSTGPNGWGDAGETLCIAASETPVAGSGGCPSVADVDQHTGDFEARVETALANGYRRILFKRGDSWTSDDTLLIDVAGHGLIGAYGSGDRPQVSYLNTSNDAIRLAQGANDWRIAHMEWVGPSSGTSSLLACGGTVQRFLMHDVVQTSGTWAQRFHFTANCVDGSGDALHDGLVISEFDSPSVGGGGFGNVASSKFSCFNCGIVGSHIGAANDGHNIRSQYFDRLLVENSKLGPPPASGSAVITLRSPDTDGGNDCAFNVGVGESSGLGQMSDLWVEGIEGSISDESGCQGGTPAIVTDSILEGSFLFAASGSFDFVNFASLLASRITVRNNLANEDNFEADSGSGHRVFDVSPDTSAWVYNVSCATQDTQGNTRCIQGTGLDSVENVVHYAPNASPEALDGSATVTGGNQTLTGASPFSGTDFTLPASFVPTDGGVLDGAGVVPLLPRLRDVDGDTAPVGSHDVGGQEQ